MWKSKKIICIFSIFLISVIFQVSLSISQTDTGLQPLNDLFIVDSNDRIVGKTIDNDDGYSVVLFQLNRQIFQLSITPVGYRHSPILFTSSDCTGTPYIETYFERDKLIFLSVVGPPDNTVYLPIPESEFQVVVIASSLNDSGCHESPPPLLI